MKISLLTLLLLISISASSQIQVLTNNVRTNDLVYDPISDRIYASIPSTNGINGNSIGAINPTTSTLEYTVAVGSEPTVLALSDDYHYIYTGFDGISMVKRFVIAFQSIGLEIPLGDDPTNGSYYAEDIEVMPGQAETIAISLNNKTTTPSHEGVVIYDDNIIRTLASQDEVGSNVIEFKDATTIYGYNNETTEYGIRNLTVTSAGVAEGAVTQSVLSGDVDFILNNNTIYATDGKVVDVTTAPSLLGQFPNANGPVVYDENFGLAVYASSDISGTITLKRYDPSTYLLVDQTNITQATGTVKSIAICGEGCYTFNTSDNKVVIVRNLLLGVTEFMEESQISLYPNPAYDYLSIKSSLDLKSLDIVDINGRIVRHIYTFNDRIDISNLSKGIYIVKMLDQQNRSFTEKLIKDKVIT